MTDPYKLVNPNGEPCDSGTYRAITVFYGLYAVIWTKRRWYLTLSIGKH